MARNGTSLSVGVCGFVCLACLLGCGTTAVGGGGGLVAATDAGSDAVVADANDALSGTDASADAGVTDAADADDSAAAEIAEDVDADVQVPPLACGSVVGSVAELVKALQSLAPGTTLCIADGTYTDAALSFTALGTAAAPIVIAAQHPGQAVFTGKTQISMGGAYATLQGLYLKSGQSAGTSLVELKSGKTNCDHCRITQSAIVDFDAGNTTDVKWVSLYGQYDRVDHCVFSGKTNPGTLLVVWRQSTQTDFDQIDHNLFANRPVTGTNGNEAIRIGTGAEASTDSSTTVEANLFVAMSGDAEIISVKSGANVIHGNTFQRCIGQVTLRNGSGSTVDGNIFLTEGATDAGGIRVIGAKHRVTNNYVEGVRTTSAARGGLVIMSGQANAQAGGYAQVQDALVAFNTVYDCDQSLIFGADTNPLQPSNVTFANNLIAAARTVVVATGIGLANPTVIGNLYAGAPLSYTPATGFTQADPQLVRAADGLMRPTAASAAVGAAQGNQNVLVDIDGQPRTQPGDVGCDQINATGPTHGPLARADVGPTSWSLTVP